MAKKKTAPVQANAVSNRKVRKGSVKYTRQEVNVLLPLYFLIRDVIEGEPAIKGMIPSGGRGAEFGNGGGITGLDSSANLILSRALKYLPQPNADDKSPANLERYRAYVMRAVFYNVTARTLGGMTGQVFLRDPVMELPKELDSLKNDSNGTGLSLIQLAKLAVKEDLSYGRLGILVDYPVTSGPVTAADVQDGDIRPTLTVFYPWDIINWRTMQRGAKRVLSFLVLRETLAEEGDEDFEPIPNEQYRVLSLDQDNEGSYTVEIYREEEGQEGHTLSEWFVPTDADGKPLKEIPFHFIGSDNNGIAPNKPPLYDLASLNIAHYRNSADHEEASFIAGQPTPVLSGLTKDWVTNVLKGSVTLGSRASIPLPQGGTATLLQANTNTMPGEGMKHKEDQMVALGAKLVQKQLTARTAVETIVETTSESSTLANVAKNVSVAFEWALGTAAKFVIKGTVSAIKFSLNTDFDLTNMTPADIQQVVQTWIQGGIAFPEMREVLRKGGYATLADDVALKLIQKEQADMGLGAPNPNATADPNLHANIDAPGPIPKKKEPGVAATA
jgi:hypothetical protein